MWLEKLVDELVVDILNGRYVRMNVGILQKAAFKKKGGQNIPKLEEKAKSETNDGDKKVEEEEVEKKEAGDQKKELTGQDESEDKKEIVGEEKASGDGKEEEMKESSALQTDMDTKGDANEKKKPGMLGKFKSLSPKKLRLKFAKEKKLSVEESSPGHEKIKEDVVARDKTEDNASGNVREKLEIETKEDETTKKDPVPQHKDTTNEETADDKNSKDLSGIITSKAEDIGVNKDDNGTIASEDDKIEILTTKMNQFPKRAKKRLIGGKK